ncbi:hypothetical protein D4R51_03005 [bacterium]|nr:MAG: hypothetical protein D4R51_03005 [bacterium]
MSEIPKDDFEGRKKYDFSCKIVDTKYGSDERITIEDMLENGWQFGFREYRKKDDKVLLNFYKEKKRKK